MGAAGHRPRPGARPGAEPVRARAAWPTWWTRRLVDLRDRGGGRGALAARGRSTWCCTWRPSRSCGPRSRTRSAPSPPTSWARPTCWRRCAASRACRPCSCVTSDKVYANAETGRAFVEGDALGGKDPYSGLQGRQPRSSSQSYAKSYFDRPGVPVATARGGNVIGGGDFSRDRLVSDIVRAGAGRRGRWSCATPRPRGPGSMCWTAWPATSSTWRRLATDPATPRALNFGPQPGGPDGHRRRARDRGARGARRQALAARARSRTPSRPSRWPSTPPSPAQRLGFESRLDAPAAVRWTMDWYRRQADGADRARPVPGPDRGATKALHDRPPACRFCRAPLTHTFLDLGVQPLSNSYLTQGAARGRDGAGLSAARPGLRRCFLVQADDAVPADAIFDDGYAYFSSFSTSWVEHCRALRRGDDGKRFGLGPELAGGRGGVSNDGYLLQYFAGPGVPVLGIEPTANTAEAARSQGRADRGGVLQRGDRQGAGGARRAGRPDGRQQRPGPRARTSATSSPASRTC